MLRTPGRFLSLAATFIAVAPSIVLADTATTPADHSTATSAKYEAYSKPDGASYFALSLMPQATLPAAESCNVVVLFDTAAREMGPYREKGLEMLRACWLPCRTKIA